jgi:ribosome recycling factor
MVDGIIEKYKEQFEKKIAYYKEELGKIRTGRASAGLVENLSVDYYGAKSPLKQIASITIPEARQILITPWSRDSLVDIEKAIRESQLNLNPTNDGVAVRIIIPALNEERRRDLVKVLGQKTEEARIGVKKTREDIWKEIQSLESEGHISEDDKFSGKDKLQKVVDECNNRIEEIRNKKEEEIMTV